MDETTFKSADTEKIKNLFNGTGSYAYSVATKAAMTESYAKSEAAKSNTYTKNGTYNYNYNSGNILQICFKIVENEFSKCRKPSLLDRPAERVSCFTKQTEGNRLIICLLICSCIVYLTFSCHNITFEIFVISRNLVYHASIRKKLDDAVRSCLYDLMVTAGKQDDTREFDHTIIQCGDGFHIQVVCRLIKD